MSAYVIRILTMSLLCSLVEILSPAGEREGLQRAVRLTAALCLLTLMITPLRELREFAQVWDLGAWAAGLEREAEEDYERLMEEKLTAVGSEQVAAAVNDLLASSFGIDPSLCTVTVECEEGDTFAVRCVWISLRGRAALRDPREIEYAIRSQLGYACAVSVG